VQFGDARLVFLPVRSVRGTFAWATSPYLLRRFQQDLVEAGVRARKAPTDVLESKALVTQSTRLVADARVVFEDFDFERVASNELTLFVDDAAKLFFDDTDDRAHFAARVCVVHDDVMSVLLQTATEVTARIRLDPASKTVAKGALWTEEALPVETLLAGLVLATPLDKRSSADIMLSHVEDLLAKQKGALQVGGNATVGRGLCRARLTRGEG
jgi:CRISPR-associated protein Cmr4